MTNEFDKAVMKALREGIKRNEELGLTRKEPDRERYGQYGSYDREEEDFGIAPLVVGVLVLLAIAGGWLA